MKVKIKFTADYLSCNPDGSDWIIKRGKIHEVDLREHPIFGECYYFIHSSPTLFMEKRDLAPFTEEVPNSIDFIIT